MTPLKLNVNIYFDEPILYVEAYYVFNSYVFKPYLEHSKCKISTNIMTKVSECLVPLEKISGSNEIIIKSIKFIFETWASQTPHAPTRV